MNQGLFQAMAATLPVPGAFALIRMFKSFLHLRSIPEANGAGSTGPIRRKPLAGKRICSTAKKLRRFVLHIRLPAVVTLTHSRPATHCRPNSCKPTTCRSPVGRCCNSRVAKGWQIGSGPVESACKTVIGERMKGGGMRWGPGGADAMSHLRAVFCSADDQWAAFWSMN